jgi:outer membrane protein OmpA-like peptidoglycan-associated protein
MAHQMQAELAEGEPVMVPRLVTIVLCSTVAAFGCATKSYVNEQVTGAETKLAQQVATTQASLGNRADSQETKLREVAEYTGENRQAIDTADQRLKGLDTRVTEVDAAATNARARAEQADAATRDAEARLAQRLAGRNSYRALDTKAIYFDSGRIDIRSQDFTTLDEVAKALAADRNAILELQGFADTQGSDRYNRELARERIEVVMRYLMVHHDVELRQMQGIPMGKIALSAGEKATPETLAQARRVDLRVLAPWSSWEDRIGADQSPLGSRPPSTAASPGTEAPSALPREVQRSDAPPANKFDSPARTRLPAFLRTLTPRDLGGE